MSKIFKAVAAGMKAAALAMIRLLVALGKLPAAVLAAMMAATGSGADDVPEAPLADERHKEIAAVETQSVAPAVQANCTMADELIAYLAQRWGTDTRKDVAPRHWPITLSQWAAGLPQDQWMMILHARSADVQDHIDGVASIPGVWPVASWQECRDREHLAALKAAGRPRSEDLVDEVLDQEEDVTVPTVG